MNIDPKLGVLEEWEKLGFRSGLEIHHQLNTVYKLFCRCPVRLNSDIWHAELLRHMRPTMSELGEYDGTALMEFKTRKEIIYRMNRETVCTYEMDDNPPFPINEEAVDKALTIALAFNCKIVGELHVIRKQYLDGSIPTGFQRTTIVGVDGVLPLPNNRSVKIVQIGLEEDACREVSDVGHRITFFTDRLSIPLIEVVTAPTLATPLEVAEATRRIGRLLRATGFVRRGIGAVRQDVNLSITDGTRVEIKGVPRIPRIPFLLAYEAYRQKSLLDIRAELWRRGFQPGDRPGEIFFWNGRHDQVHSNDLKAALLSGDTIRVIKLPNVNGLLTHPLAAYHRFADEFAGRIRVVACLDQNPNMFHTEGELGGLDDYDRRLFQEFTGCSADDVALIVWGADRDTQTAAEEVLDRLALAIKGIPNETRQALRDNTTDFERVLPGPDRMYPDTDSPPYEIVESKIEAARKYVPEPPWEKAKRYRALGLPEDIIERLAIDALSSLFDRLVEDKAISPMRAGEVLIRLRTALSRLNHNTDNLFENQWESLLRALGKGEIQREILLHLLQVWSRNPEMTLTQICEKRGWIPATPEKIEKSVRDAWLETLKITMYHPDKRPVLAMSQAMARLAGCAPGKLVWQCVQKMAIVR